MPAESKDPVPPPVFPNVGANYNYMYWKCCKCGWLFHHPDADRCRIRGCTHRRCADCKEFPRDDNGPTPKI
ncbi:drs2 neo1 protein [Hypoxylon texense]